MPRSAPWPARKSSGAAPPHPPRKPASGCAGSGQTGLRPALPRTHPRCRSPYPGPPGRRARSAAPAASGPGPGASPGPARFARPRLLCPATLPWSGRSSYCAPGAAPLQRSRVIPRFPAASRFWLSCPCRSSPPGRSCQKGYPVARSAPARSMPASRRSRRRRAPASVAPGCAGWSEAPSGNFDCRGSLRSSYPQKSHSGFPAHNP